MQPEAPEHSQSAGCSRGIALKAAEATIQNLQTVVANTESLNPKSGKASPKTALEERRDERSRAKESSESRVTRSTPAASHLKRNFKKGIGGRSRARTVSADVDADKHRLRTADRQNVLTSEKVPPSADGRVGADAPEKRCTRGSQQRRRQIRPGDHSKELRKTVKQNGGSLNGGSVERDNGGRKSPRLDPPSAETVSRGAFPPEEDSSVRSDERPENATVKVSLRAHRMQQPAFQDSQASQRGRKLPPPQEDLRFRDAPTLLSYSAASDSAARRLPFVKKDFSSLASAKAVTTCIAGNSEDKLLASSGNMASLPTSASFSASPLPVAGNALFSTHQPSSPCGKGQEENFFQTIEPPSGLKVWSSPSVLLRASHSAMCPQPSPPLLLQTSSMEVAEHCWPPFLRGARSKSQTPACSSPLPFWGGAKASRLKSVCVEYLESSGRGGVGDGCSGAGSVKLWGSVASLPGTLVSASYSRKLVSVGELRLPRASPDSAGENALREALVELQEWIVSAPKELVALQCFEVQGADGELLESSAFPLQRGNNCSNNDNLNSNNNLTTNNNENAVAAANPHLPASPPRRRSLFIVEEATTGPLHRCLDDAMSKERGAGSAPTELSEQMLDAMATLLRGLRRLHALRGGQAAHLCLSPESLVLSLSDRRPKVGGAIQRVRLLSLFAEVSDLTRSNPLKAQLSLKLVLEDLNALVWLAPSVVQRLRKLERTLQRLTPLASSGEMCVKSKASTNGAGEAEGAREEDAADPVLAIARLCRFPSDMQQRADIWGIAASLFHLATRGLHPYGSLSDLNATLTNMLEGRPVNMEKIRDKPLLHHLLSRLLHAEGEFVQMQNCGRAGVDGAECDTTALLEEALAHPIFWKCRELRAFASASAEALQRLGRRASAFERNGDSTHPAVDSLASVRKALRTLGALRVPASSLEKMRRLLREAQQHTAKSRRQSPTTCKGDASSKEGISALSALEAFVAFVELTWDTRDAQSAQLSESTLDRLKYEQTALLLQVAQSGLPTALLAAWRAEPSFAASAVACLSPKKPQTETRTSSAFQKTQGLPRGAAKFEFPQNMPQQTPPVASAVSVQPPPAGQVNVSGLPPAVPYGLEALREKMRASQLGGQEMLKELLALVAQLNTPNASTPTIASAAPPVFTYSATDLLAERPSSLDCMQTALLPLGFLQLTHRSSAPQQPLTSDGAGLSCSSLASGAEEASSEARAIPASPQPKAHESRALAQLLELLLRSLGRNQTEPQKCGAVSTVTALPPSQGFVPPFSGAGSVLRALQNTRVSQALMLNGLNGDSSLYVPKTALPAPPPHLCVSSSAADAGLERKQRLRLKAFELIGALSRQMRLSPSAAASQGALSPDVSDALSCLHPQTGIQKNSEEEKAAAARHDTRRLRMAAERETQRETESQAPLTTKTESAEEEVFVAESSNSSLHALLKLLLQPSPSYLDIPSSAAPAFLSERRAPSSVEGSEKQAAFAEKLKKTLFVTGREMVLSPTNETSHPPVTLGASLQQEAAVMKTRGSLGSDGRGLNRRIASDLPVSFDTHVPLYAARLRTPVAPFNQTQMPPSTSQASAFLSKQPQLSALRQALLRMEQARAAAASTGPNMNNNFKVDEFVNKNNNPTIMNNVHDLHNNSNFSFNFNASDFNPHFSTTRAYVSSASNFDRNNNSPTTEQRRLQEQLLALERSLLTKAPIQSQSVSAEADFAVLESRNRPPQKVPASTRPVPLLSTQVGSSLDSRMAFAEVPLVQAHQTLPQKPLREAPRGSAEQQTHEDPTEASSSQREIPEGARRGSADEGRQPESSERPSVSSLSAEGVHQRRIRRKAGRQTTQLGGAAKKTRSPQREASSSLVGIREPTPKAAQLATSASSSQQGEKLPRRTRQSQKRNHKAGSDASPRFSVQQPRPQLSHKQTQSTTKENADISGKVDAQRGTKVTASSATSAIDIAFSDRAFQTNASLTEKKTPPHPPPKNSAKNKQLKARLTDERPPQAKSAGA